VRPVAGNRQPPLGEGWGIFNWRNGEFSSGVDTRAGLGNFRPGGMGFFHPAFDLCATSLLMD